MARLYFNENFPLPVVEALRHLGHDVLTIQEAGMANRKLEDQAVLEAASADNRAVLTINRRHFICLHSVSADHKGIIVCTVDRDFAGQAQRIHDAITSLNSLEGQLIRVNRPAPG